MIKFNPFDCEFNEIEESIVQMLIDKSVGESWYIEYKESLVIDPKKVAKSISSFANAEGGWYFMGIKSDEKTTIATEICGFEIGDQKDVVDQVSKLITGNISPIPDFEIRAITLTTGKYVFIILVEEGIEPPYITSSGTIYQREHNANNPVRDRYLIEKMHEKTLNNQDLIERFSSINYGETKAQGESDQAYLELFLFPSPFNSFHFKEFLKTEFFEYISSTFFNGLKFILDIEGEKYETGLGLSFNAIFSSFNSLVIRPLNDDTIIYKGTTVELFQNGGMKFLLPLYTFKLNTIPQCYEDSEVIKYLLDRFCPFEEKAENNFYISENYRLPSLQSTPARKDSDFSKWFELIDGHQLILIILYIVKVYSAILDKYNYPKKNLLGFRARIDQSWRKIVFFNNLKYLEAIKKYNIPATPKTEIEIPTFRNGNYLHIENEDHSFISIVELIFEGIGIPRNEDLDYLAILKTSIKNLKQNK